MTLSRIFTILKITLHVLKGCFILLLLFPWFKVEQRHRSIRHWCKQLLAIFKMRLSVIGAERLQDTYYLMAANMEQLPMEVAISNSREEALA